MSKESEFFLVMQVWNQNKSRPVFRWVKKGDITLGCKVAKQYIANKIPEARENHYSLAINLSKNGRERGNQIIYEREPRQGYVRKDLDTFETFLSEKFGFSMETEIKNALA